MLSVALVVSLSLAPQGAAPDRSTPEKAISGFVEWKERSKFRNLDISKRISQVEVLGAEHCAGKVRTKLDSRRKDAQRAIAETVEPKIETKILKRSEADGVAKLEVEVWVRRPEKTERWSKHVIRFELSKQGNAWAIEKMAQACWACGGNGVCSTCGGKSADKDKKCNMCEQPGRCRTCKGKGFQERVELLPRVSLALPGEDPKFANDWGTAESAAKAYADLLLRRRYEESKIVKTWVEREISQLAVWLSPGLVNRYREDLAKAVRGQEEQYEQERLVVRQIERTGDRATAILDNVKGHPRPRIRKVELRRLEGKWKVVEVRAEKEAKPSGPRD